MDLWRPRTKQGRCSGSKYIDEHVPNARFDSQRHVKLHAIMDGQILNHLKNTHLDASSSTNLSEKPLNFQMLNGGNRCNYCFIETTVDARKIQLITGR